MKINPKIKLDVQTAQKAYRKALVNSIVELAKQVGARSGEDVALSNDPNDTIFLYDTNQRNIEVKCIDRLSYLTTGNTCSILVMLDSKGVALDSDLSIDNLETIYKRMCQVVTKE